MDQQDTNATVLRPDQEPSTSNQSAPPLRPTIIEQPAPRIDTSVRNESFKNEKVAYFVSIISGLLIISSASYIVSRVLSRLFSKEASVLFFNLESFDIYALIALFIFGAAYFIATHRAERYSVDSAPRKTSSAVWQTILVITLLGSFVALVFAPLNSLMTTKTTYSNPSDSLMSDILSAAFVIVVSALFLWRDLYRQRTKSTLVPTLVASALITGVFVTGIVTLFIIEKPTSPEVQNDYGYSDQLASSVETETSKSKLTTYTDINANIIAKKAEAYNTLEGEYPSDVFNFDKYPESDLTSTDITVTSAAPMSANEIRYIRCSIGAQISYLTNESGTIKILALGGANDTEECS